jgi:hypothetical protein
MEISPLHVAFLYNSLAFSTLLATHLRAGWHRTAKDVKPISGLCQPWCSPFPALSGQDLIALSAG